jgi:hypothetical protein
LSFEESDDRPAHNTHPAALCAAESKHGRDRLRHIRLAEPISFTKPAIGHLTVSPGTPIAPINDFDGRLNQKHYGIAALDIGDASDRRTY